MTIWQNKVVCKQMLVSTVHQVRPQLARHLELLVDRDGLRDVDRPRLRVLGRVVQLAQRGVARARVVPAVGGLLARAQPDEFA